MSSISILAGKGGSRYYDSSVVLTLDVRSIHVTADAVIGTLTEKSGVTGGTDVTGATEQNISGKTIPAGAILTPKRDVFDTLAVTSGKLTLFL